MEFFWNMALSILILGFGGVLIVRVLTESGLSIRKTAEHAVSAGALREIPSRKELWCVFGAALAFRLLVFFAAGFILQKANPEAAATLCDPWIRWDARHYIGLSRHGYAGYLEEGTPLFLVFFPLYVWLMRAVSFLGLSSAEAGLIVSFLCFAFGCRRFYALASAEYGRKTAKWSVVFLSVFPFSFFFGGVMTESLFFLTTVSALDEIRRHRFYAAGIWGFLAALTRMQGVLLIVAAGVELFAAEKPFSRELKNEKPQTMRWKMLFKQLPAILLPLLGTGGYCLLNWWVAGDALAFLKMQSHWNQGMHPTSGTLWYVLQNAIQTAGEAISAEIWWPQFVLFFAFFAILLLSVRRGRTSFLCYGYGYLLASYSLSWLLSGGRYLSCDVPVFLFLGMLTRKRPAAAILLAAGMAALFSGYLSAYLTGGAVM